MTDFFQSFTPSFVSGVAVNLITPMIQHCGRRMKKNLLGTGKTEALERCTQKALVALLSQSECHTEEEADLLREIFEKFFRESDTQKALSKLLENNVLDKEELKEIFSESGFDEKTLPGMNFKRAITTFEIAFIESIENEKVLQPIIQTHHIRRQTQIQESILKEIQNLLSVLSTIEENTLKIGLKIISGNSKETKKTIVHCMNAVFQDPKEDIWYLHYLTTLIGFCDPLDLAAIDQFQSTGCPLYEDKNICVSDVFTPLYLEGVTRSGKDRIFDIITGIHKKKSKLLINKEEKQLPISATEASGVMDRLVILGQPGSGKSTLVNHLAVLLAKKLLNQPIDQSKLSGWDLKKAHLPVRIILRRFAAWLPETTNTDKIGLIWDFIKKQLKDCGIEEVYDILKAHLLKHGGVVFFDGLDEISDSDEEKNRSTIIDAIEQFSRTAKSVKIIITCREYAYASDSPWRFSEKLFPVVHLSLFNMEQIKDFNAIWYIKVGTLKGWDHRKCHSEAFDLTTAIERKWYLLKLAKYPLLLTLMASVHGSVGRIPEDRADLYHRCIELLLSNWQYRIDWDIRNGKSGQPGLLEQIGVSSSILTNVLSKIVFDAHERQEKSQSKGTADISVDDIRRYFVEELKSWDKAENAISYIQQRAGLLVAKDNRIYTFPHRTFQEYLAAKYILRQSNYMKLLKDRLKRDVVWWREVFLLTAAAIGKEMPSNVSALANTLLPEVPTSTNITPLNLKLANVVATAFEDTRFKTDVEKETISEVEFKTIYQRILLWITKGISESGKLPAKERAEAGQHLALMGDHRDSVVTLENMIFCYVAEGPFWMGSIVGSIFDGKPIYLNEQLTYPFWMAQFPITQAQYKYFTKGGGYAVEKYWPEAIKAGYLKKGYFKGLYDDTFRNQPKEYGFPYDLSNHPVVGISWYESLAFVRWLNDYLKQKSLLPKRWAVHLPSESEWERQQGEAL